MKFISVPTEERWASWEPQGNNITAKVKQVEHKEIRMILINPEHIIAIYPPSPRTSSNQTFINLVADGSEDENGVMTHLSVDEILNLIDKA